MGKLEDYRLKVAKAFEVFQENKEAADAKRGGPTKRIIFTIVYIACFLALFGYVGRGIAVCLRGEERPIQDTVQVEKTPTTMDALKDVFDDF